LLFSQDSDECIDAKNENAIDSTRSAASHFSQAEVAQQDAVELNVSYD
jgi:hypothetical protein